MKLQQTVFRGMSPRIEPHLLDPSQAQDATNCKLSSGALQALYDSSVESSLTGSALRDLYNFEGSWFPFTARNNIVRAPVFNTEDRFYYTVEGSYPRKSTKAAYAASGTHFKMGVPRPTSIPTVTLNTDPAQEENPGVQDEVSYCICFVTGWGEQGPPGDPSAITTVEEGQYIGLSNITLPANYATDYNIVGYRLFRLSHGLSGSEYLQVYTSEWVDDSDTGGHIPVSDLTPTDRDGSSYALIDSTNLGGALASEGFQPPPDTLDGLVLLSNGVCAGFVGNEIYLSEPFLPFAWNPDYGLATDYDIVALGSFGTTIVVLTEAYPYIIDCYDPASATMRRINEPYPCSSADSVAGGNGFVAYASPLGFIRVGANGVVNMTEEGKLFTDEQWETLGPSTLSCRFYDNRFFFFSQGAKTGFILDFTSSMAAYIPFNLTNKCWSAHVSVNPNGLYLLTETDAGAFKAELWEGATPTRKTGTYKSAQTRLARPINFSCACVHGDQAAGTSVAFTLYGDGAVIHTKTITDEEPFWLPDGVLYQDIEVKLETSAKVVEWALATSIEELAR